MVTEPEATALAGTIRGATAAVVTTRATLPAKRADSPQPPYFQLIAARSTISFPTIVLLFGPGPADILLAMAKYSALLGKRIQVTYRAGDIVLPATGNLAADSGKSIFLEESYKQLGNVKTFRWEIPYPCIVVLSECAEIPSPSASVQSPRETSAETAREAATLQLKDHPI